MPPTAAPPREQHALRDARARTLDSVATLAFDQGDYGAARACYEESMAICEALLSGFSSRRLPIRTGTFARAAPGRPKMLE